MGDYPWQFTFCDMRTGEEWASLPLTGVKYARSVRGVGRLDGYLTLTDERIRAADPWTATRPRRVAVYVEYGGVCVWCGPVVARDRNSESDGMAISAVTWEGWLHRQRLLRNIRLIDVSRREVAEALVAAAQEVTDVGMTVEQEGPSVSPNLSWRALDREVKPILELIDSLDIADVNDLPFEYRVMGVRDEENRWRPRLLIGEPRLGRRYEDAPVDFAWPNGGLLNWKLPEDGSAASNVMTLLGAGSGALQPFDIVLDHELGIDEIASGFPTWMEDYRAQDTGDMRIIHARAGARMRSGQAAEKVLTGVRVRASDYLGEVQPGDDLGLEITSPVLEEWPAAVGYVVRVLGESVTVGSGGKPDAVSLTVGGAP